MVARDDLNASALQRVFNELRELRVKVNAGFSSITRGSLRIASEEGLIVQGSALIVGLLSVLGRVRIQGLGILEVLSLIDLLGSMRVRGGGTIDVEAGGAIVIGNVRIEDGKIIVGVGGNQIIIDGATGKITAGSLTIDPAANGGSVKFAGGPEVYASGAQLSLYSGSGAFIELDGAMAKINGPGARWVEVNSTGIRFVGMDTAPVASFPGGFIGAIVYDGGEVKRLV